MDGRRIGRDEGVEFAKQVRYLPPNKGGDQCSVLIIDPHYGAEVTVEDLLVIVVLGLHHPITRRKPPAKLLYFGGRIGIEHFLELDVEVAGSEYTPVHRAQHLNILHGIKSEPARHAFLNHLDNLRHTFLMIINLDEVEVALLASLRR